MNPPDHNTVPIEHVADLTESIHMCRKCGCLWRQWKAGQGWSLADGNQRAGKCCDNSADFFAHLAPPPSGAETARLREAVIVECAKICIAHKESYIASSERPNIDEDPKAYEDRMALCRHSASVAGSCAELIVDRLQPHWIHARLPDLPEYLARQVRALSAPPPKADTPAAAARLTAVPVLRLTESARAQMNPQWVEGFEFLRADIIEVLERAGIAVTNADGAPLDLSARLAPSGLSAEQVDEWAMELAKRYYVHEDGIRAEAKAIAGTLRALAARLAPQAQPPEEKRV